jgi:kynurenine formamidase
MSRKNTSTDRRDFIKATSFAAAAAAGGCVSSESDPATNPFSVLKNLQILDLSVAIEDDAPGELSPPQIEYIDHKRGGEAMRSIFECDPEDLPFSGGDGWAVEQLVTGSHTATHIDAPYHYGATSEGRPARTIDEVPLEWCFGPGVVLDMRSKEDGDLISVADLETALRKISYELQPLDIVMIHTGAAERWGTREYLAQPGLGREGTLWLVEQGVKIIGIDAWTLDRPFDAMIADFKATGDGRVIWPELRESIARSRSWPIWKGYPDLTVSMSPVSPSRSKVGVQVGVALWH